MKIIVVLLSLFSFQVFSADFCGIQNNENYYHTAGAHSRLTFKEKQMIHLSMSSQKLGVERDEAINSFFQQDGLVQYFKFQGHIFAVVHYYQDGNEFGAVFMVLEKMGMSFKEIAVIEDGYIYCS